MVQNLWNSDITRYIFFAIVGTLLLRFVGQLVANLVLSPLRRIPGPFLAKITSKWLLVHDLAGNRTTTIDRLHQRYGPIVRVAPQELSFSDASVVKEIYGPQSAYRKAPIYTALSMKPVGIFSMRDKAQHAHRRRLLSPVFSQTNLLQCEPLIKDQIANLDKVIRAGLGKPLDMWMLCRLFAFDVSGQIFFGQSFGGLESGKLHQYLEDLERHFILAGIEANFPWIYWVLTQLPFESIRYLLNSRERMVDYGKDVFNEYILRHGRDSGRADLLTKILVGKSEAEGAPMTDQETYMESGNMVLAASDTTSSTLTYLIWRIAKHQGWQQKLREELETKLPNNARADYMQLVDLPILDAFTRETLRLHPAAPGSLFRETPAGGRVINDVFVPEKTVVSMQCYTTQRDVNVFPRADEFLPQRWLGDNPALDPFNPERAKSLYMPFSTGSRNCIGQNMAMMELKSVAAALVRSYSMTVAPTQTEEGMNMIDHFLMSPKGGKCEIVFEKVGQFV